jgi:hypothetical protein
MRGLFRLLLNPLAVAGGGGAPAPTEVPDVQPVNGDGTLGGGGVNGGELPDSALSGLHTGTANTGGSGVANLGSSTGSLQGGASQPAATDWQSVCVRSCPGHPIRIIPDAPVRVEPVRSSSAFLLPSGCKRHFDSREVFLGRCVFGHKQFSNINNARYIYLLL